MPNNEKLLKFIDNVVDRKYEPVDKKYDDIRSAEIFGEGKVFHNDQFTLGAVAMLKLISEDIGWKGSEQKYYNQFVNTNFI